MSLKQNYLLLAEYNRWMNESVYKAMATLGSEVLMADKGAFFKSILGTANHLMVADIVWLKRFASHPFGFSSLKTMQEFPQPEALNSILYTEYKELWSKRQTIDAKIVAFTNELDAEVLESEFIYKSFKGQDFKKNFGQVLQHFFNHQTHHRGQLSTLLFQSGVDIGVTDFLMGVPNIE